jgi:hypothetical protein
MGFACNNASFGNETLQIPDSSIALVVSTQHQNRIVGRAVVCRRCESYEHQQHPLSGFDACTSVIKVVYSQTQVPSYFMEKTIGIQISGLIILSYGGMRSPQFEDSPYMTIQDSSKDIDMHR